MSDDTKQTADVRGADTGAPRREWRPLLNGEYPPPGPTKYGEPVERDGQMVRPILVYVEVKR